MKVKDLKGEIKIDSDFSRILKRDDSINLNKPIDFRLSYTKEYFSLVDDNYTQRRIDNNLISSVKNEIEQKIDESLLLKYENFREEHLDVSDLSYEYTIVRLRDYLREYNTDFMIANYKIGSHFFSSNFFVPSKPTTGISRSIFHYGTLYDKIDYFINHSIGDNNNIILCGKRGSFSYNFYLEWARVVEDELNINLEVRYYLETNINEEDFFRLHFHIDKDTIPKSFTRDKTIDNLLN
jgi:hypothetical protein